MKENPPLISIVLPTHNGIKYLKESIDSCLVQSYPNIELIIVVDGSTDGTEALLSTYHDNRMSVIFHNVNVGLPRALNSGFKVANGQYLTWTSDDNYYAPNAIEEMVKVLVGETGVDFVYCDYWEIDKHGVIGDVRRVGEPEYIMDICIVGACFLYQRKVYETIGEYDPDTRLAEDYDYWMRVSRSFKMQTIHQPLYYYRIHENALSGLSGIGHKRWRIITQSKRKKLGMGYFEYHKELSKINIDEAFFYYNSGIYQPVPFLVLKGLLGNPGWLMNRGVISIAWKSIFKFLTSGN